MIAVVAHWRAAPGAAEHVARTLAVHATESEREPGCLTFAAHRDAEDPDRFVLYEVYADASAFAAHRTSEHFIKNVETGVEPLLIERSWRTYGPRLGGTHA